MQAASSARRPGFPRHAGAAHARAPSPSCRRTAASNGACTAHDVVMLGRYPHQAGFGGPTPADREAVDRAILMQLKVKPCSTAPSRSSPAANAPAFSSPGPSPWKPPPAGRRTHRRAGPLPPAPRHGDPPAIARAFRRRRPGRHPRPYAGVTLHGPPHPDECGPASSPMDRAYRRADCRIGLQPSTGSRARPRDALP
jgi:hypothetical protein